MLLLKSPKFWTKKNSLTSILLYPLSILYLIAIFLNKKIQIINSKNIEIKTICVGNLYIGGTGKTPTVMKLYEMISKNKNCCVIKKFRKQYIDEINLLKKFTNLITKGTRVQALIQAKEKGNEIAIMDDGMQDFTFKKNISILCVKSKQSFGNQKTLPSGPLREPLSNIKNYQIAIINGEKNNQIEELLSKYNKDISIYYSNYELINKDQVYNKKFLAFSGIADNQNFFSLLEKNKATLIIKKEFNDHFIFNEKDILNLMNQAKIKNLELITTEKNHQNLPDKYKERVLYAKIKLNIDEEDKLINEIY
jgi:tetraacyldisaccharide 4'-kinase